MTKAKMAKRRMMTIMMMMMMTTQVRLAGRAARPPGKHGKPQGHKCQQIRETTKTMKKKRMITGILRGKRMTMMATMMMMVMMMVVMTMLMTAKKKQNVN